MKYKFIYFDLDDTLLDHKKAEQLALKDVHEHFSFLNEISLEYLIDTYHQINSQLWFEYGQGIITKELLQKYRFERTLHRLTGDGSKYLEIGNLYLEHYRKHWYWIEGAERAWKRISSRVSTGILTNGFSETQRLKFETFRLCNTATVCVISEEIGSVKPQPEVFEKATELAGVQPNEILYIGDSFTSDVEGGTRFGWDVAWFINGNEKIDTDLPVFTFNNYGMLLKWLNIKE